MSTLPSGCDLSDDRVQEVDMKDNASNTDPATASPREKTIAPPPGAANENPNLDRLGLDDSMDADNTKIPGTAYPLRPLLRIFAGTSSTDFDFSGSIAKILDEQREIREMLKEFDPLTTLISTKLQAFKDSLQVQKYIRRLWQRHLQNILVLGCYLLILFCCLEDQHQKKLIL